MIRALAVVALVGLVIAGCSSAFGAVDPTVQPSPRPADTPDPGTSPRIPEPKPTRTPTGSPQSFVLTSTEGIWTPPQAAHVSDKPAGTGMVSIDGIGQFAFDTSQVQTERPDIFQPGHFSVFDALVQIAKQGNIRLEYHFDDGKDTHVVDAINGQTGWWYRAHYSGGWAENNVFRMDMFPYKNGMNIRLLRPDADYIAQIYHTFEEEVVRLERNDGQVIIPELTIRSPNANYVFHDVAVTPHNVRNDVFQPGVVTALDALLSLGEQGELPVLKLTWYDRIGSADPVQHYFVEQIGDSVAYASCGFVYETGPTEFRGFTGSHIHIPSDLRATVSPEYALWFWICL
jgi:hypothetical protein